jgi:type-F conjugative transfer system pilin assembly protein TrbC
VDNSVEATLQRVHALYGTESQQAAGLVIDPTLFTRFGIGQVPSVVVAESAAVPCTAEACAIPAHVKLAGDVPLRYALERIARARPVYQAELRDLIKALEPERRW